MAILVSLVIAPVEINREDDLHGVLIAAAPATIVLGVLGVAISASSLYLLNLLSIRRLMAILSILSIITLSSSNRSLLNIEQLATLYIGITVILILLRRSLSVLEVNVYRASIKIIDLVIMSWIATIAIVGVPMLIAALALLLIKSNSLIPRDLRESINEEYPL
ncbi:hypothetical protein ATG_06140 [Desulfurococcaceae archaeon AG1]|nr:hypothetical protein ATG_06140 [Desulfurococcaceae archaeon AG1]